MIAKKQKIVCFGDSITRDFTPFLQKEVKEREIGFEIINEGVGGETVKDALERVKDILKHNPDIVIVGFGTNDAYKNRGITIHEFEQGLVRLLKELKSKVTDVRLLTLPPKKGANGRTKLFNKSIKRIALANYVKIINIYYFWNLEFGLFSQGLRDYVHPNEKGNRFYAEIIIKYLKRRSNIILWQYNGNPCACNYRCPYCTYDSEKQEGHYFEGTIDKWRKSFLKTFGDQRLVFYLAHGEPMIGEKFYDVLKMIGDNHNWSVRLTSNISQPIDRLVDSRLVKEKRLDVNASFHPTMVDKESFLEKLLFLRKNGIEPAIIYVVWPPFLKRLESDIDFFNRHGFLVHLRRFQGTFNNKKYPEGYEEEERRLMARYMDDAMIKYILSGDPSFKKLTWSGVDFFIVDNKGNVGYCDDFRADRYCLGNIFNKFEPFTEPKPFPGRFVSDGTVDGVANFLELDYWQLDCGNNVISFSHQGGVSNFHGKMVYKNTNTNFDDPFVRTEYRFPPRNIKDCYFILRFQRVSFGTKLKDVIIFLLPNKMKSSFEKIKGQLRKSTLIRKAYRTILKI